MQFLWGLILLGYLVSTAHAVLALAARKSWPDRVPFALFIISLAAHTVWLLERGIQTGRCPLVGTQETFAFLSWSLMASYLATRRLYRSNAFRAFIFPLGLMLAIVAALARGTLERPDGINEPLQRILFPVHAGLIMLAYAAFFIAFGAGLMYIIQERELKLKRFRAILYKLPSLDACDAISFNAMTAGLILLAVGIAAGFAWSRARDGIFWHGELIEVFSLFTLVIYLLIIQFRISAGWGGRKAALASIVGFVLVVCSLAGVRYLGTLHVFG